jgi:hypothetical protein
VVRGVPWAFGPILTAGVAIGAAAVVVANPVVVPRADIQIAVADLPSTVTGDGHGGSAVDMLDEDFIRAVGHAPADASNPFAALTDLVRVLVADAAQLGRNAILHAFATGARVIADPALTSTSYPYVPVAPSDPAALPWPGPWPGPFVPGADGGNLGPVVAQALTAILADVGEGGQVRAIAAAFAAGAALATANVPVLGDVVESLGQDLVRVVSDAAAVVAWLPRPGELIGGALRAVITVLPQVPAGPRSGTVDTRPAADSGAPIIADPVSVVTPDRGSTRPAADPARPSTVAEPAPPSALADRLTDPAEDRSGPDAIDANDAAGAAVAAEPVADRAVSVVDEPARSSLPRVADALGAGSLPQRESVRSGPDSGDRSDRTGRPGR